MADDPSFASVAADDLSELTPEALLRAVAAIFAAGIGRLAGRVALPHATSSANPAELDGNRLEETGKPWLSVHAG